MPTLIHSLDRRSFLKTAGLGAGILAAGLGRGSSAAEKSEFRVALVSDTHIPADPEDAYRGFKPVENFKKITPEIVEWKPELVLHNGDVARLEGKVEDYQAFLDLLKPISDLAPVCLSMGNHDDRTNFGTVFKNGAGNRQKVASKNVFVLEHALARFIVLDSLMYVNKTAGQLGKAQRDWLAGYLPKVADRPAIIFVHHTLGDADGELTDADRLFAILEPHKHVKAIFYGHSHVWALTQRQGIQLINQPAVAYPFSDNQPVGWVEGVFRADGVDLKLRACGANMAENGKVFEVRWS